MSSPRSLFVRRVASLYDLRTARLIVLCALGLGACGDGPLGLGIGLPPFAERPAQAIEGLTLARAYIPPPGSTGLGFVELYNASASAIDLARSPMTLESQSGSVALDQNLWAANSVLQVTGSAFAALGLHSQAGELVLLDSNLVVGAYGSWGNDPNSTLGSFAPLAKSSGRGAPWRELPFPLADGQAIALDAGRPDVACADASLGAAYPPAAMNCAAGAPMKVWLSRVVPQGLDGNGSAVELYNAGSAEVDVWGLQLCRAQGGCTALYPHAADANAAGATVLSPASALGTGAPDSARRRLVFVDGLATSPLDLLTTLTPIHTSEELALAAPGSGTGAALSYVRLQPTGSAQSAPTLGPPLLDTTTQSLWQRGLAPPRIAGEALALATGASGAPSSPNAWRYSALPFLTALSDPNAPWDACSQPKEPAVTSVAISQVVPWDFDGTTLIELSNLSAAPVSLSGLTLQFGANSVAWAAPTLQSNATLWLALTPQSGCQQLGVDVDFCASGLAAPLAAGEFLLANANVPLSFVQWLPSAAHAGVAVSAGLWPTSVCKVAYAPSYEDVRRIVRLAGASGQSPADYAPARLLPLP